MQALNQLRTQIGVVVIGRNEGERLLGCLRSLSATAAAIVYVDSGSTDNSVSAAQGLGVHVLALDMSVPFTASRARNVGFRALREVHQDIRYVQFVDGDCEVAEAWILVASEFLDHHEGVAVVCGRVRERYPDSSIYNRLCDIEWDTPIGETKACGGIAMIRSDAFLQVDGFRDDLIAGEEPELCVRLRLANWKIWRIPHEMVLHDAAMTSFGQWWRRTMRAGYAFAEGAHLHGSPPERHWVAESRRAWLWGLVVPLAIASVAAYWGAPFLAGFALYPAQVVRLALRGKRSARDNWVSALFLVVGKFPEMVGQMKFLINNLGIGQRGIIEYK